MIFGTGWGFRNSRIICMLSNNIVDPCQEFHAIFALQPTITTKNQNFFQKWTLLLLLLL